MKVSREKLIDCIKARKEEAKKEHEAKKHKAKADYDEYEMRVVSVLEDAIEAAMKGKEVKTDSFYARNSSKTYVLRLPERPDKSALGKFDGSRYNRDIQILEMSPEETISISAEDFERYVR